MITIIEYKINGCFLLGLLFFLHDIIDYNSRISSFNRDGYTGKTNGRFLLR